MFLFLFKSADIDTIINANRYLPGATMVVLNELQNKIGYITEPMQQYVANKLHVPVSQVHGVVSFYSFFTTKPRGKHTIKFCMGTACFVKGAPRLLQMISDELGVEVGETTSVGRFTVRAVRCVGACSFAPVFVIGEDTFGRIETRDKINEILKKYDGCGYCNARHFTASAGHH